MQIHLRAFYISPGHNFFGRRHLPAGEHVASEPATICCRAGWGIEGDRFYGYRPDYKGQITFFSADVFSELCTAFDAPALSAGVLRRNVLIAGADLGSLIGKTFSIGGVSFEGTGEARPCHWMNHAVAPGAEDWLKGRGGLRARILRDGTLCLGSAALKLTQKTSQPGQATGFVGKRAIELRFKRGV